MASTTSPVILAAAILATPIAYVIYHVYFHPLASIPGPFWARLTRLWITKHSWDGDMNTTMMELHKKYGNLVRTGPNEPSRPSGAATKFRKSDWYSVWQGHRKFDLFAERNEKMHGEQRRLVSRPYSMDSLRLLEPYVDNAVTAFIDEMAKRTGHVIDMGNWLQLFAFDVIGEITFSRRFGFLSAASDSGAFTQIVNAMQSASWIGQLPSLYWLHDALSPYIGNHLGITARHGSLRTFATREITARQDRGSDHTDILSQLFATQEDKPKEMDYNAIVSMATSNIFAGSDTTAISLRAITYYLLKNPSCKEKLLTEINSHNLSDPVTLTEAEGMPYLQAVMYEALRLHPAVGMSLARVVPQGGATIADTYLPAGTIVGANPWVIHRDTSIYDSDVDAFRPERWLEAREKEGGESGYGNLQRYFFAFGSGARGCLGGNISWMEMSKVIPTLMKRFEIELADPEKEWETKCWWLVIQKGLDVRLRVRQ
ncbi:hypothetical protein PRZ48_014778 [Zasmidium cellare]|uniref:Cytochrome P450 n=1 Tax=Zasmidium cellare TaxID=395010 RepID=A0ABR0DZB3_ZASCE|nr:hypothetical protein PRZ48_014778 [Zasmidium cellare]